MKPICSREYALECSVTRSSISAFVASSSASYAARMSANSVLPPVPGTLRADNNEYFAGIARNDASECHSRLPRAVSRIRSDAARNLPSRSRLEMSAISICGSRRSSGFAHLGAGGDFQFAEIPAERHLRRVVEVLIVKHQHAEPVHAGVDRRHLLRGQRPGQVNARNLTGETGWGEGADGQRHSERSDAVLPASISRNRQVLPEGRGRRQWAFPGRQHQRARPL